MLLKGFINTNQKFHLIFGGRNLCFIIDFYTEKCYYKLYNWVNYEVYDGYGQCTEQKCSVMQSRVR